MVVMYKGGCQNFSPRKLIGIVVSILVLSLFSSIISAADGPGTTGALYLRLPVGPKSIAMGEAGAAIEGDHFGWLVNPGLLADVSGTGIGLFHSQWLLDTYYDNITFTCRPASMVSIGAGLTYMSTPDVMGFNIMGSPTEMLKNNSFQGIFGICVTPISNLGAGVNIKYFQERIAEWTASGIGFDVGTVFRLPLVGLSFGASLQNIGPSIKFISHEEELPMAVRVGGSYHKSLVPGVAGLALAADMVMPKYSNAYPSIGAELRLRDTICMRVGYCGESEREDNGLTAGGGIDIMGTLTLDYAWTPYGDLGDFHRVSIYFRR
jgi:hypothetical protein